MTHGEVPAEGLEQFEAIVGGLSLDEDTRELLVMDALSQLCTQEITAGKTALLFELFGDKADVDLRSDEIMSEIFLIHRDGYHVGSVTYTCSEYEKYFIIDQSDPRCSLPPRMVIALGAEGYKNYPLYAASENRDNYFFSFYNIMHSALEWKLSRVPKLNLEDYQG